MKILPLKFDKSADKYEQLPPDTGREVVFIGYSNVGKSSLINRLCNQKNMARTSRTPGRTRLFNIFAIDANNRVIDMPGYGYAKVSAKAVADWQAKLQHYLVNRECLEGILLVCDIRREIRPADETVINWAKDSDMPLIIALNKSDKLNKSEQNQSLKRFQAAIESHPKATIIPCSCLKSTGITALVDAIGDILSS